MKISSGLTSYLMAHCLGRSSKWLLQRIQH